MMAFLNCFSWKKLNSENVKSDLECIINFNVFIFRQFQTSDKLYFKQLNGYFEMQGQQVVNAQNQINSSNNSGLSMGNQVILKMNDNIPMSSVGKFFEVLVDLLNIIDVFCLLKDFWS